jgi:TP901 family phage tail tape measure protein
MSSVASQAGQAIAGMAQAAGVAVLAGMIKATKSYADFEKQMANVHTLIPGQVERIDELGDSVRRLAIDVGKDTADLTGGLYQVVSQFGDTADTMYLLETAAKASVAGLSSTTEAIDLLAAVIKGYNMDISEASKVSDYAFQTVKLGSTTFRELAASMGKAVPLAATLGVKQEELWAIMATATGVTGNTAEVATQLRGILKSLIKPTDDMKEQIAGLKYESAAATVEALGLAGTDKAVGGDIEKIGDLYGEIEALNLVLALTGPQAEILQAKLKGIEQAAGAADQAFKIQADTMAHKWSVAMAQAREVGLKLGDIVAPDVIRWLDELNAAFDGLNKKIEALSAPRKTQLADTLLFGGLTAAAWKVPVIGPILGPFMAMLSAAREYAKFQEEAREWIYARGAGPGRDTYAPERLYPGVDLERAWQEYEANRPQSSLYPDLPMFQDRTLPTTVRHEIFGTVKVEGVNTRGELIDVQEMIFDGLASDFAAGRELYAPSPSYSRIIGR